MCCRHSSQRQRGAALIVALLVFAIAAALLVGLQREFTLHMQRGSNYLTAEQGWSYLLGAESLGVVALRLDAESDTRSPAQQDHLGELWAGEAQPYPLAEGGRLLGQLEDLQGRFNINLLVEQKQSDGESAGEGSEVQPAERDSELDAAGTRYSEQQKQFVRLLGALDGIEISPQEAIGIMEAIADYIDEDVQRRVQGAEDGDYRNTNPAYRTSGRPLASVSELRSVAGITPEIYSALAPYITVWPQEGGTINVLTAPAAVLRSLNTEDSLEPLSTEEGQRLVEARAAGAITSVDDLLNDIAFASGDGEQLRSLLAERSDWFLLTARVEIADREMRLYSVLERNGQEILARYRSTGEL